MRIKIPPDISKEAFLSDFDSDSSILSSLGLDMIWKTNINRLLIVM
jgi:hypothetical protein